MLMAIGIRRRPSVYLKRHGVDRARMSIAVPNTLAGHVRVRPFRRTVRAGAALQLMADELHDNL